MIFHGPVEYTAATRHRLRSMVDVFNIKLRESLREELGGVYSVSAQPSLIERPEPSYQISVNFTCDPDRLEELVDAVFEQINILKDEGATEDEMGKIKEQQRRNRETQKETNAFWVSQIGFRYTHEDEELLDILKYEEMVEAISSEDIKAAANLYFNDDRFIRAVLNPEAPTTDGGAGQ